jgi:hypothetical protein
MIIRCGVIIGLIFLVWGIYSLLLAYRIVPLSIKDPEKAKIWHRKFDIIIKITGIISFIVGILMVIGIL